MAEAKNKVKTKVKYVSKGLRRSIVAGVKGVRSERAASAAHKILTLQKAFLNGKDPWVVVDNPNPNETHKRKVRMKASAIWHHMKPGKE